MNHGPIPTADALPEGEPDSLAPYDDDRRDPGVVWASVEDGFHVGSRDGNFLGYIDRQPDGRLLACDMFSRPVGHFTDLAAAMASLTGGHTITEAAAR